MMLEPLFSRAALILLWSALAVVGVSCSKEQKTAKISQNRTQQSSLIASPVVDSPSSASLKSTKKPLSIANDKKAVEPTSFEMGLDKAAGGFSISQSARTPEDWELVADYYQDAIKLMKSVQPQSRYYPIAKVKVKEYQRHFDYASEKSVALGQPQPEPEPQRVVVTVPPLKESIARSQKIQVPDSVQKILQQNLESQQAAVPQELPPPQPPQPAPAPRQAIPIPIEPKEVYAAVPIRDSRQAMVFSVPIKRRIGGTPILIVTFNDKRQFEMIVDTGASGTVITQQMASLLNVATVGKAKANTASAQSVEFPIGYVDSIEAGGVKVKKVPVAIAGSELENGLLGHDFFGNYDITIKSNVVEFRPRSNTESQQKSKSIPIYPTKLFEE
ncbi:MAG: retropepsin-like aspartic protease [Rivularia sp. (in: cyanobacteria)]